MPCSESSLWMERTRGCCIDRRPRAASLFHLKELEDEQEVLQEGQALQGLPQTQVALEGRLVVTG